MKPSISIHATVLASLLASLSFSDQLPIADSLSSPFWADFALDPATNAAARPFDDDDRDGLPNGAEIYIAAHNHSFPVSPTNAHSVSPLIPDYYLKSNHLYLGEIFTDDDFIEDWYEDCATDCSRDSFDFFADPDGDGWSAYETRAALSYAAASGNASVDGRAASGNASVDGRAASGLLRPSPTVSLAVSYNGHQPLGNSNLILHTFSDPDLISPDAVFVATNAAPDIALMTCSLSLSSPSSGWIKGGDNTFIAFVDLDGNNAYSAGEPFGVALHVRVGWCSASARVVLSDTSLVFTRCNFADDSVDRSVIYGSDAQINTNLTAGARSGGRYERVRVILTQINGYGIDTLAMPNRVILDKTINLDARPYLSEADFFAAGAPDLDWDHFQNDVMDSSAVSEDGLDPTNVTYRIVMGGGTINAGETNNLYHAAPIRCYGPNGSHLAPIPLSPAGIANIGDPFLWSMPDNDISYSAFKVDVLSGSDIAWSSGLRIADQPDNNGVYSFFPDLLPGDIHNNSNYTWRVSMFNSKFQDDCWSNPSPFRFAASDNLSNSIQLRVRYFGPLSILQNGSVIIEAFDSQDFASKPLARASVSSLASLTNLSSSASNASLSGLPSGHYFVRAYIDLNSHGSRRALDRHESFGFASSSSSPLPVSTGSSCDLYIHDVDSNNNHIPDAWEIIQNNGSLDSSSRLDSSFLTPIGPVPACSSLSGSF